jgi:hypothetical protein
MEVFTEKMSVRVGLERNGGQTDKAEVLPEVQKLSMGQRQEGGQNDMKYYVFLINGEVKYITAKGSNETD